MHHKSLLLALASLSFLTVGANAQRIWIEPDSSRTIGVEFAKGFLKSNSSLDFASFLVTVEGRYPLNPTVALTAALPFSRLSGTFTPTKTSFGNPWLGVEYAGQPGLVLEAGIRPGIATGINEDALSLGIIDDFDRYEAWLPEATSVRAVAHIGPRSERQSFVSGYLGGTMSIPKNGGTTGYLANYGIRAGWRNGELLVSAALTGRANLSHLTGGGSLDERTMHQVAFIVERTHGRIRPSASVRTFLDPSARKSVDAIMTAGAAYVF